MVFLIVAFSGGKFLADSANHNGYALYDFWTHIIAILGNPIMKVKEYAIKESYRYLKKAQNLGGHHQGMTKL